MFRSTKVVMFISNNRKKCGLFFQRSKFSDYLFFSKKMNSHLLHWHPMTKKSKQIRLNWSARRKSWSAPRHFWAFSKPVKQPDVPTVEELKKKKKTSKKNWRNLKYSSSHKTRTCGYSLPPHLLHPLATEIPGNRSVSGANIG